MALDWSQKLADLEVMIQKTEGAVYEMDEFSIFEKQTRDSKKLEKARQRVFNSKYKSVCIGFPTID